MATTARIATTIRRGSSTAVAVQLPFQPFLGLTPGSPPVGELDLDLSAPVHPSANITATTGNLRSSVTHPTRTGAAEPPTQIVGGSLRPDTFTGDFRAWGRTE